MEAFNGADFQNWKFKLLTAIQAVDPELKKALVTAETCESEVEVHTWTSEGLILNSSCYALLVKKTGGRAVRDRTQRSR